jgi:hypothetical protein
MAGEGRLAEKRFARGAGPKTFGEKRAGGEHAGRRFPHLPTGRTDMGR